MLVEMKGDQLPKTLVWDYGSGNVKRYSKLRRRVVRAESSHYVVRRAEMALRHTSVIVQVTCPQGPWYRSLELISTCCLSNYSSSFDQIGHFSPG